MTTTDMPSDWEKHAYPGLPEVRLLRAIYGLCPTCDHGKGSHRDEEDSAEHDCRACPERVFRNEDSRLICLCGNWDDARGFQPCLEDGTLAEPLNRAAWAAWTGLYACLKCGRVIDQDTLIVTGKSRLGGDSDAW